MRIVLFLLVEYPLPVSVNRFKIRLYSGCLVNLAASVLPDMQIVMPSVVCFANQRLEDLLKERILQAIEEYSSGLQ